MTRNLFWTVAAGIALLSAGLIFCAPANAATNAEVTGQPSATDLRDIHGAITTAGVAGQLSRLNYPGATHPATLATPAVGSQTVPVYELARDFTAGSSGAAVGALAYVAVPASTGHGAPVTLWAARTASGWQTVNIASGTEESQLAALVPAGAVLLHEPQLNAWYALSGSGVRLLRGQVPGLAVGATISVSAYQRAVSARYGDKLPGSAYARAGLAGGYGPTAGRATSTPDPTGPGALPLLGVLVGAGLVVTLVAPRCSPGSGTRPGARGPAR